jgi:hypothetical protein
MLLESSKNNEEEDNNDILKIFTKNRIKLTTLLP